jgi:hypothetical protein
MKTSATLEISFDFRYPMSAEKKCDFDLQSIREEI